MKITEVKINLVTNREPLKAFASVTIADSIVIHDLRIIKTTEKTFVAMPSKKMQSETDGRVVYKDIVHPINKSAREEFEKAILLEYKKVLRDLG